MTTLGKAFCPHAVAYNCPSCLADPAPVVVERNVAREKAQMEAAYAAGVRAASGGCELHDTVQECCAALREAARTGWLQPIPEVVACHPCLDAMNAAHPNGWNEPHIIVPQSPQPDTASRCICATGEGIRFAAMNCPVHGVTLDPRPEPLVESDNATGYHAMAHGNGGNHSYARPAPDTALDVERLARAVDRAHRNSPSVWRGEGDHDPDEQAAAIAREYAALEAER